MRMTKTIDTQYIITAALIASAVAGCGEGYVGSEAPAPSLEAGTIEVASTGPGAQPVPESLSRQVLEKLEVPSGGVLLGFFSRGMTSDGRELFKVVSKTATGEQHAFVGYEHARQALNGCADEACERETMAVEFTPVNSAQEVRAMVEPSPACIVAFYEHQDYVGDHNSCYSIGHPPSGGTWILYNNQVTHNDTYTSHKTYDQFCRDQGIGSDCTQRSSNLDTNGAYYINVESVRVFQNPNRSGYDAWLEDTHGDFNSLRWCKLCGTINDKISSFEAQVRYSRQLVGTASGSLAQGQEFHYNPLTVLGGTKLKVVMTGTNDPDLYVRFGTNPTTTAFDCRPYTGGAYEICDLVVPNGQSSAYIMVRGYTASTYNLTVNYTEP
jgi:hypothetical protein